ncbi:MAG: GlsB/YeaQ/YmgE family stress response membrane protein [Anaerolineales bacterium]
MGLLSWIIVGLIAGWLANQVMRGGRGNAATDIVVGVIGALVGGFLASQLFGVPNAVNGVNVGSLVVAFLGSIVAIVLVRALPGRSPL